MALTGIDPPLLTGIDPLMSAGSQVVGRARRGQATCPQDAPVYSPAGAWLAHRSSTDTYQLGAFVLAKQPFYCVTEKSFKACHLRKAP